MTTLCCSQAILDQIGIAPGSFPEPTIPDHPSHFGNWFIHLVMIERKRCAIFVNGTTLLSFLVPGVTREELEQLPETFMRGLRRMLISEGVGPEMIDAIDAAHGEISIGIRSRYDWQVIDCLEDLVLSYRLLAAESGGLEGAGLDRTIRRANQIPRKVNGAKNALKAWIRQMKRLPLAVRISAQRTFMAKLRQQLASGGAMEMTLAYVGVIPEIFTSLPDFMQACHDNDIECTMPEAIAPTPADLRLRIRLQTLLTRLGIPMPERN